MPLAPGQLDELMKRARGLPDPPEEGARRLTATIGRDLHLQDAQALARRLLRDYRDGQDWDGAEEQSPAGNLLDRLVWSSDSPLSAVFAEARSRFGDFAPALADRADARAFLRWALKSPDSWQARVIFPTYLTNSTSGQLLWASVRTVPRSLDDGEYRWGGRPLIVAPWSDFDPLPTEGAGDNEGLNVTALQDNLVEALRAAGASDPGKFLYLLELRPLDAADFPPHLGDRDRTELTPQDTRVDGPSLGLAIFLAAWAALQHRSLRTIIATGTILRHGNGFMVGPVGGLVQKRRAVARFVGQDNPRAVRILRPPGKADDPPQMRHERKVELFDDFLKSIELTDGFDPYRDRIGMGSSQAAASPLKPLPVESWTSEEDSGYSPDDRSEVATLAGEVLAAVRSECPPSPPHFRSLSVPFGEAPKPAAYALAHTLISDSWWERVKDRWGVLPVIVPIELRRLRAAMAPADRRDPERLPADLARLILESIPDDLRPNPPSPTLALEAIENALRTPRKLVLIAHDAGSRNPLEAEQSAPKAYRRALVLLRRLAVGDDGIWQPQHVIAVCSDEHHRRVWERATEPTS